MVCALPCEEGGRAQISFFPVKAIRSSLQSRHPHHCAPLQLAWQHHRLFLGGAQLVVPGVVSLCSSRLCSRGSQNRICILLGTAGSGPSMDKP